MGCDIHCYAEVKIDHKWISTNKLFKTDGWYGECLFNNLFYYRSYNTFAFLADVRNYANIEPLLYPRGIPDDCSNYIRNKYDAWGCDAHSASHIYLNELESYDYNKIILNERDNNIKESVRDFLGESYFNYLSSLRSLGYSHDIRIVFWFDN